MKNNYLDNLVKQSLEDFNVDMPANAWSLMAHEINQAPDLNPAQDANMLDNADFDAIVKDALVDSNVAQPAMNWIAMSVLIDQDPMLNGSETAIDEPVKEVLQDISAPYTPAAWDMMEAHLDLDLNMAELQDDEDIDHAIYEKIGDYHAPYDASSWNVLAAKLNLNPSQRDQIVYRFKIVELALMSLLLYGVSSFLLPSNNFNAKQEVVVEQKAENTPTDKSMIENIANHLTNIIHTEEKIETPSKTNPSTPTNNTVKTTTLRVSPLANITQKQTITLTDIPSTEETNSLAIQQQSIVLNNAASNMASIPQNITFSQTAFPNITQEEADLVTLLDPDFYANALNHPLGLSLLPTEISPLDIDENTSMPGCLTCAMPNTVGIRVAMFWMGEYNYIMTPTDRIFDIAGYNNGSLGYGLGATIAMSYGKWEVETGALYSAKSYSPEAQTETIGDFESGYVKRSLSSIQFNALQVPLNIRYNFDNLPNWNFYTSAGASLHVAAQTSHHLSGTYEAAPSLEESISRNTLRELIEKNSTFNDKNFADGWFEGGSFLENRYFTANIGVGFERSIGSRWSVFTQSWYQHTLLSNGFGPNKDRLNTLSIFAGARTQIGTKVKKKEDY